MIRETLIQKLNNKSGTFEQEEIQWILENIGHENPEIRDDLVFNLFSKGLFEEWFTIKQYEFLVNYTIEKNLIFFQMESDFPAVLTRSFSALLNAYLIKVDGDNKSKYHDLMNTKQRSYFFESAISYLNKEHVFIGYSEKYGWVHCFAHGADFLAFSLEHPEFPAHLIPKVFKTLENTFLRLPHPFISGEERRLGRIIELGLLNETLEQKQVANWLNQLIFPLQTNIDTARLATFEVFLSYIYFHLLDKIEFEEELKEELLKILKEI